MTANIGTTERLLRALVGVVLLSLVFVLDGVARWSGLIGLVPLVTAAVGWCPLYVPFGFSTRRR